MSHATPRRTPALYAPMLRFGIRLAPDAGEGAGGGSAGDGGAAADAAALDAAVARVLEKHSNDPSNIASLLIRERSRKDEEIATLKRQVRDGKLPAGGRALTAVEAAEFDAFKALGKPAKEIGDALMAGTAAVERVATLDREKVEGEAATLAGYKPSVLSRLAKSEGFTVEIRDETVNDQAAKVPYAKKGDGAPVKLADFATQHLTDFLPALSASGTTGGSTGGAPAPAPAIHYPVQSGQSGTPAPADPVERRIAARDAAAKDRPSPFTRARVG